MTSDMIRRFDRDTGWVATGVLCAIIFAALLLATATLGPAAPPLLAQSAPRMETSMPSDIDPPTGNPRQIGQVDESCIGHL